MRVRTGLVAVIYEKALVLSNDERGKSSGDIVNLMSVDASRLQDLCAYGLMFISAPYQVTKIFSTPRELTVNLQHHASKRLRSLSFHCTTFSDGPRS